MRWPWSRPPAPPPPAEEIAAPPPSAPAEVAEARHDAWRDAYGGMGTEQDPRRWIDFLADPVTDEQALELYRGSPLAAKLADAVVKEGMRPGFRLEIAERDTLRGRDGREGGVDVKPADDWRRDVEAEWRRLRVMQALQRAAIWERVRGGAALLLGLDDKVTKAGERPRPNARLAWVDVVAHTDLYPERYQADPYADRFGEVEVWRLNRSTRNGAAASRGEILIHADRLVLFRGRRVTDETLTGQHPGFGDSRYVLLRAAVRRFERAMDSVEMMLHRHGEPWWRLKDLAGMIALDKRSGASGFQDRLAAMARAISMLKTRVVDADDEIGNLSMPLAGVPEIIGKLESELAAIGDMPVTELWGEAPGVGLGDSSAGPRGVWHALAQSYANEHLIPPLVEITRWIMAGLGGEPEEWSIKQPPRAQMSAKEEAELDKIDADTDVALVGAGIVTQSQAAGRAKWKLRYHLEEESDVSVEDVPDDIRGEGGDQPDASDDPPQAALTGPQVAGLVGVVKAAVSGEIPRESAVEIVMLSVPGIDRDRAERIVGPGEAQDPPPDPPPDLPPEPSSREEPRADYDPRQPRDQIGKWTAGGGGGGLPGAADGGGSISRFSKEPPSAAGYSASNWHEYMAASAAHEAERRAHTAAVAQQRPPDPGPPKPPPDDASDEEHQAWERARDAYDESPAGIVREARAQVIDDKVSDLESDVDAGRVSPREGTAAAKLARLSDNHERAVEELAAARRTARDAEREAARHERDVGRHQERLAKLESEAAAATGTKAAQIRERIARTRDELQASRELLDDSRGSIADAQRNVPKWERAATMLKERRAAAKQAADGERRANRDKLRALRRVQSQLEDEKIDLDAAESTVAGILSTTATTGAVGGAGDDDEGDL